MPCCESFINSLPVLFAFAILGWTYYVYVIEFCIYTVETIVKQIPYIVVFHLLFALVLASYFSAMFSENDAVPDEFKIPPAYVELLKKCKTDEEGNAILQTICKERRLQLYTVSSTGLIRYCNRCKHIKPDRAHHCSTCKTCIPKMDHHCPWINNCVGFANYKIFLAFLFHMSLFCFFVMGTMAEYFVRVWVHDQEEKTTRQWQLLIEFIVGSTMGVLIFILFFYHMALVFRNETTLESMRETEFRDPSYTYDLGWQDNFLEVFGENCWCWCCPVRTAIGNGIDFQIRTE